MARDMRGTSPTIFAFHTCISFSNLFLARIRTNSRSLHAKRGPLISVVLPVLIAKAEQCFCEVTAHFSLLFDTRSNVQVRSTDITEKLYTNSLVIDFPKDDP